MRLTTLLLPLAASAATIQPRQASSATLAGVDKAEPRVRKTAQRTITKFGPYTLSAASTSGKDSTLTGNMFFQTISKGFCNDKGPCTVLAGKVGVMYADGSPADPSNGIYIHHILTSDTSKHQTPWLSSCGAPTRPGRSISAFGSGTGFLGTGEDSADGQALYTSEDGTRNSGYHIGKGDSFLANMQVVNYNKEPKKILLYYDMEWVPGQQGEDIKGTLISVTQCGNPVIKLSASGPTNTTSGKFYFMEDGRILGARAHLHDGGVQVDMNINDKYQCSSKAVYGDAKENGEMGGHGHGGDKGKADASIKTISHMTTCAGPIKVKKGDSLSMNVQYDLAKHPLRKSAGGHDASGVMGMWGISFAADPK